MLKATRLEKLFTYIRDHESASFRDLEEHFGVSKSTLRRDLMAMESTHPIQLTRGGVILVQENKAEPVAMNQIDKIGQKAAELVQDDDMVMLDAGRTTLAVAKAICTKGLKNLTVVATSLAVVETFDSYPYDINLVILGGEYRGKIRSVVGPVAEEGVRNFRGAKLFIGCTALAEDGFYTTYLSEISVRRLAIESAQTVILVLQSEKFDHPQGYLVDKLDCIDWIVTDKIPNQWKTLLDAKGIQVFLTE